jgi:prepilin-type processing-associated H-X9-DG protein
MDRKHTIRPIEVLAAIGVATYLIFMSITAIQRYRESSRRANCTNNMKEIGLGLLNYEKSRKFLPGSAEVVTSDPQGPVGGWSFLFKILPHMEYNVIYNSIDPANIKGTITDPVTMWPLSNNTLGTNSSVAIARDTQVGEFLCPNNPKPTFEHPGAPVTQIGVKHAVTNYKAMCSAFYPGFTTNSGAQQQYTGTVTVPPGEYAGFYRCDGALYPANAGIRLNDISDGLSRTILCGETLDYTCSAWISGTDVNMIAIPTANPPQANVSLTTTTVKKFNSPELSGSFFAIPGFNGRYDSRGGTSNIVTFFNLEYGDHEYYDAEQKNTIHIIGKDAGTYPLDPMGGPPFNSSKCDRSCYGGNHANIFGPSSGHPSVINCLFADGSVHAVRKDVDASALFFAVTRANNDPSADDHL